MGKNASVQEQTSCWTTGYRYAVGLHHVLCQAAATALITLRRIEVGGRWAWTGEVSAGSVSVDAPHLFGGDEREGGVVGTLQVGSGSADSGASWYLASQVGRSTGGRVVQVRLQVQHRAPGGAETLTIEGALLGTGRTVVVETSGTDVVDVDGWWSEVASLTISGLSPPSAPIDLLDAVTGEVLATLEAPYSSVTGIYGSEDAGVSDTMPAYRGVLSVFWQSVQHSANNPYLKPVRYQVQRAAHSGGWYPAAAAMSDGAMNPAHILHELLTEPVWGLGLGASDLDDAAFRAAADTLAAEDLGLDLVWDGGTVQDIMQTVLDHCEGRLYQSPRTGLWRLDLLRDDYDAASLPELSPANVVAVESCERRGWDECVNQVVVEYVSREAGEVRSVAAQNLAAVQIQGGVVSETRRYPGLGTSARAARVAERDLRTLSRPLARVTLTVLREAWDLGPGDSVRVSWPDYGVAALVCRVAEIDTGTLADGTIRLTLIEDVFAVPATAYLSPQPPQWEDPASEPQPCPHTALMEAPYWDVARTLSAASLAELVDGYGFALAFGARPSGAEYDYRLYTDDGSGMVPRQRAAFTPTAGLASTVGVQDTELLLDAVPVGVVLGTWALVGDPADGELVAVTAISGNLLTVDRGVLDTVPQAHALGARIWFGGSARGQEGIERVEGDALDAKLVPRTGLGPVPIADVPADTLTLDGRAQRPYPPGNVALNGEAYPASQLSGDLEITWSHRDRTQQTAYLVPQTDGDIGPEPGTTYTVTVYDDDTDTQLRQWTGLTGTTQTYTQTDRESDMGSAGPHRLRVEITSHRDGLVSWQRQSRTCDIA